MKPQLRSQDVIPCQLSVPVAHFSDDNLSMKIAGKTAGKEELTDPERNMPQCYFVQQNLTSSLFGLASGLCGYCSTVLGRVKGER
jgi:hypothetical protein